MSEHNEEIIKPPHPSAAEKARAVEFLRSAEAPSYREIAAIICENPQGERGRHIVLAARAELEREGIFFSVERNKGLLRCDDNGKNKLVSNGVRSVRRKTKRLRRAQVSIDFSKLEELQKLVYSVNSTIVELLNQASGRKFNNTLKSKLSTGAIPERVDLVRLLKPPKPPKSEGAQPTP
jgi:hypothetical protein